LRVEAMIDRAHVRRFVVQYEAYIDGRWQPIIRYDTAHGFAHRDIYHARNPTMKEVLAVQDFNEAFTFAMLDPDRGGFPESPAGFSSLFPARLYRPPLAPTLA